MHPLAGQGVNLGFGDVQCLADILAEANYSGLGLNNLSQLVKYEQERLKHNVPVLLTTHGLQRLYTTDFPPIVGLRSIGLTVTNALPPVKVCRVCGCVEVIYASPQIPVFAEC